MQRIPILYIQSPTLLGVYQLDQKRYILIEDIPNQADFFCNAISLDKDNKVYIRNNKAETSLLQIIRK